MGRGGAVSSSLLVYIFACKYTQVRYTYSYVDELMSPGTNSQEARQRAGAHIWHSFHGLIADCALITNSLSYGNSGRKRCHAVAIQLAYGSRNGRQVVGVNEPALWLRGIVMSAAGLTR